jgi:hypothetical protein
MISPYSIEALDRQHRTVPPQKITWQNPEITIIYSHHEKLIIEPNRFERLSLFLALSVVLIRGAVAQLLLFLFLVFFFFFVSSFPESFWQPKLHLFVYKLTLSFPFAAANCLHFSCYYIYRCTKMSSQSLNRRIFREMNDVLSDVSSGVTLKILNEADVTHLKGSFSGPPGTPYEGGLFVVDIKIPIDCE